MNLRNKSIEAFPGKVVRKDLTQHLKSYAVVPSYVLEYLLGQHCSTDDENIIKHGIEKVQDIITGHYVHREEAEVIKSKIRDKGTYRIIDKLMVVLNDRMDRHEANFSNLRLKNVPISDDIVRKNPKLLSEGVWSLINVGYMAVEEAKRLPWIIEDVKPIQISKIDMEDYIKQREAFDLQEWIDFLMRSIGLNPEEFTERTKLIQLSRLIPFAENNFNLIELGPKGTGKSHIYSEMSPHGILLSGGEVTRAKLFVNNASGRIGLVGYWDVIAYDEFAGKNKKVDQGLVDIMKNYMANKSFSRGTDVYHAEASFAFIGNTDRNVANMLKNSHMFIALPKEYQDSAFLDRIHLYIPGWEVSKLRNELFTNDFGFIVDYIAEVLKQFRKENYSSDIEEHFILSDSITTRDKTAIEKTYSGLVKILFPHGKYDIDDAEMMLNFAIEGRRRVKLQLQKMDETFEPVDFSYKRIGDAKFKEVITLEEIQYLNKSNIFVEQEIELVVDEDNKKVKPQLTEKHRDIKDNEKGISYNNLFGEYFIGAKNIIIEDSYIRFKHQRRNFIELLNLIASHKEIDQTISVHLQTFYQEGYQEDAVMFFKNLSENLAPIGIDFSFEFNEFIHDRFIQIDDEWKIVLGRGLDIWNKTDGPFDIAETNQLYRTCKSFHMSILKTGNIEGGE